MATSSEIEEEIIRALKRKFGYSEIDAGEIVLNLLGRALHPKDDHILECALKAQAALIISGDKDLLALGRFRSIQILTPWQYLDTAAN